MSEREALQASLDKWRARWPEWAMAEVFVPAPQRERAQAWFALREELAEAAWGGQDPRPGEAKLGWWAEELAGWARGARRHPLGLVLQPIPAGWERLAAGLPALRATRDIEEPGRALAALAPWAEAVAGVAPQLFAADAQPPVANVAASLLGERLMRQAAAVPEAAAALREQARALLAGWPPPTAGTRPGRMHAALLRGRLLRMSRGAPPQLPRLAALGTAWRAARG